MSDQDGIDTRLLARFEREHGHVPADSFVTATMRQVRAVRRRRNVMHAGMRAAVLLAAVATAPWLISGASRLNAALGLALAWAMAQPVLWALGIVAALAIAARRVLRR